MVDDNINCESLLLEGELLPGEGEVLLDNSSSLEVRISVLDYRAVVLVFAVLTLYGRATPQMRWNKWQSNARLTLDSNRTMFLCELVSKQKNTLSAHAMMY